MKTLLLAVAVLLISGCSTTSFVKEGDPAAASLQNQMAREGAFTWRLFLLRAVDSKPVSYPFMNDGRDSEIRIPAGTRRLVVEASFNTGFGGAGPQQALVLLVADVEAGRTYRLFGEPRDNTFVVWLEDPKTKAKLSNEGVAPYGRTPSTTYMPIIIPAR